MKTSINFKGAKLDSETHNFRKKSLDYIRKDLTPKNEYWMEDKILDKVHKIETYCKEKSGRKLQKNAMPVREAVVVIKEDTTMLELHNLSKKLEEQLKIRVFQIAIHKDEGHYDIDTKEWKPNFHAHLVADWQDLETGKTLKHQSFHYSKMQDLASQCLGMERGISGSLSRLEAIEFKIKKKEEDLKILEERYSEMKAEIESKKLDELIVKESDFLGFQKIKIEKTIENYKKAFKVQNTTLVKSKIELESKSKQISELNVTIESLKKEIDFLKGKNSIVLTNEKAFAFEKKKYLDSVQSTLEKAICFERLNPNLKVGSHEQMIEELNKILEKVAIKNNIPPDTFKEIYKDSKKLASLFTILRFGEGKDIKSENNEAENNRKHRFRR